MVMHIFEQMSVLPVDSIILLRRPRLSPPGWMEANVAEMADTLHLEVDWFEPEMGGRGQTFERDFSMVSAADQVVAYFDENTPMEGGTAHVVEAAMMRGIPVRAWTVGQQIERLGELPG